MMNVTFNVRTLFDCDKIESFKETHLHDSIWTQTVIGCKLLHVLQDMYKFNMTYAIPDTQYLTEEERRISVYPQNNDSIDIYAKPMSFTTYLLESASPMEAIFTWRYGFILKRQSTTVLHKFYSLPFTRPLWNCLYLMILLASGMFFYLSRWERRMLGGYSCYHYELLLAIGACCQHILPLQANICSRRIAYLCFILFTYILHCFYTSNLLSHLVSDKDSSMDLEMLANSDYECALLGNLLTPLEHKAYKAVQHDTNLSIIQKKLTMGKLVNMKEGLNAVMTTKTALLVDYSAAYPVLSNMFETDDICQLIEIDLYSNVKKYFYTSKTFSYEEEFKVGILRAKEAGILRRLLQDDISQPPLNCAHTYPMSAEFEQIIIPLCILIGSCAVAGLVVFVEKLHYQRSKVWPYVD